MSFKYNILWLDDKPIKALGEIREANPDIYFDKVDYMDVCKQRLESNPEKYHAVILDANGISSDAPEKEPSKRGFLTLVHTVIDIRIPLYIYSGQLDRATDGDTADMVLEALHELGLRENENIFFRSGGPYDLIDKIVKDFDNKYQFYVGHEHFLSFFSKGWIKQEYKTEFLDPIMEIYYRKDYNSTHGNQMRNLTEQMLVRVNEEFGLDTTTKANDPNRYKNIVRAIKVKKLDFSSLVVGPLMHMIEVTNGRSHEAMTEDDRKLYFESDYSTFFIVANWFNKLMSCTENAQDDVAEVSNETTDEQTQINQPNTKAQTHENNRSGVVVPTYKRGNHTYCDIKVEIPWPWKQYNKVKITGIKVNPNGEWSPYCQEVKE